MAYGWIVICQRIAWSTFYSPTRQVTSGLPSTSSTDRNEGLRLLTQPAFAGREDIQAAPPDKIKPLLVILRKETLVDLLPDALLLLARELTWMMVNPILGRECHNQISHSPGRSHLDRDRHNRVIRQETKQCGQNVTRHRRRRASHILDKRKLNLLSQPSKPALGFGSERIFYTPGWAVEFTSAVITKSGVHINERDSLATAEHAASEEVLRDLVQHLHAPAHVSGTSVEEPRRVVELSTHDRRLTIALRVQVLELLSQEPFAGSGPDRWFDQVPNLLVGGAGHEVRATATIDIDVLGIDSTAVVIAVRVEGVDQHDADATATQRLDLVGELELDMAPCPTLQTVRSRDDHDDVLVEDSLVATLSHLAEVEHVRRQFGTRKRIPLHEISGSAIDSEQ